MDNFTIGEFLVIPAKNQVINNAEIQNITPKMMAVLCVLASKPKQTISKEDINSKVWKTVEVSDLVLTRAIADLRKVFNESAKNARYIQTVSKKGYCLNKNVETYLKENASSTLNTLTEKNSFLLSVRRKLMPALSLISLILVASFTDVVFDEQPTQAHFLPGKPEHISTGPEITRHPRFSPDGSEVYYLTSTVKGLDQIASYSLSNKSSRNIYQSSSALRYPTVSPDGKRLAFFQSTSQNCKIQIIELESLAPEEELKCPSAQSRSLDWAPDSQSLLTNIYDSEKEMTGLIVYDLRKKSYTKEFYPEESQTGYLFPRLSPDGTMIATFYVEPSANLSTVRILKIEDGTFTDFATENSYINQVVWGENTTLYYAIASGDREGVWSLDLNSSEKQFVFSENIIDMDYSSKTKAFVMNTERRELDVWSYNPSLKREAHARETFSSRIDRDPVPSPDNNHLAFVSDRDNANNVWIKDRKNSEKQRITSFKNGTISDLFWAKDNTIYFSRSIAQESVAYKLKPDMELERVFDTSNNYRFKYISTDGKRLYFTSDKKGDWRTFMLESHSNKERLLFDFPVDKLRETNGVIYFQSYADTALYQIELDHTKLNLNKLNQTKLDLSELNQPELAQSKPDQSELSQNKLNTKAISFFQQPLAMSSWEISRDQLYFVSPGKHKNSLLFKVNLQDKKLSHIGEFPVSYAKPNYGLSVAENSGEVFYTRLNDFDRDILLLKAR